MEHNGLHTLVQKRLETSFFITHAHNMLLFKQKDNKFYSIYRNQQ